MLPVVADSWLDYSTHHGWLFDRCAAVRREALQQLQLESSGSDYGDLSIAVLPKSPPRISRSRSLSLNTNPSQTPSRLPPLQRESSDSGFSFSASSRCNSSRFSSNYPSSSTLCNVPSSSSSCSQSSNCSSSRKKKKDPTKLKPLVTPDGTSVTNTNLLQSSLRRRLMECCNMTDED